MPDSPVAMIKNKLSWAMEPTPQDNSRAQSIAFTILRILLGLMWLYNVSWKRAPDFGQDAGDGLYKFTKYAVDYPVLAPYAWVTDHLILPVFPAFGWVVLIAETALAVMLLTGTYVRLAALIGLAQSLAIGLSVAYAPNEWPWSYFLMIGAHLVLVFAVAGRVLGTDGVRGGTTSARTLGQVWSGVAILTGVISLIRSFSDPLAARGPTLGSSDPSLSLGSFNLIGSLVLIATGALLLLGVRSAMARLLQISALLAVLAAASLYVQLVFTDPILGGDNTSAALFICAAVVAFIVERSPAHLSDPSTNVPAARAESDHR